MVVDDTLSMRIYSFIDNILINKTIKQIKQKIDFIVFCVRHLGLIVTAVTINGFTPVNWIIYNHLILLNLLFGDENLSQAANKLIMVSVQDYIHASGRFL